MQVIRQYYNSSDELLRIDEVEVNISTRLVPYSESLVVCLSPRILRTTNLMAGTIDYIYIIGDYVDYDDTGVPYNYRWVSRTLGNGQPVIIDMSDLLKIGDVILPNITTGFGHGLCGHTSFGH